MNLEYLRIKTTEFIKSNPEKAEELKELFFLAVTEVESGESEENEVELALFDMEDLINDV